MSSFMPPPRPAPDGNGAAIRDAVTAVAEQSFFALVDRCDGLAAEPRPPHWLFAIVRFDDGQTAGSLLCWLPPDLALALFDAFSGRDPAEPVPGAHQIDDLVGEFSNMVCGDWLCRSRGRRAFHLSPPIVVRAPRPAGPAPQRLWVKINDRPLAIEWDIALSARPARIGR